MKSFLRLDVERPLSKMQIGVLFGGGVCGPEETLHMVTSLPSAPDLKSSLGEKICYYSRNRP